MRHFESSATAVINSLAQEMKKSGIHVYNFSAGDPIIQSHPSILKAANNAVQEGLTPYAPVAGLFELRQAAADWMNRRSGSRFAIDQTIVTCGGKFGIYAALQILLEPGDEVLIPAPYWVSYPEFVSLAKANPKIVHLTEESAWKITPKELKSHISTKSRIFMFNNPCNPTGALYTREEVKNLLDAAAEANLTVIADEVYSELVYDNAEFVSCASFPEHKDRVIIIESCSKNFAMAGWRVGFAFGPKEIITNMIALQSQTTTGTSIISQKAALGALLDAKNVSTYVRERIDLRRKAFFDTYNRLFSKAIKPVPATIYYFGKIEGDSVKACEEILKKAHVALVPGIAFGMEGYIRFVFSDEEEEIVKGLTAIHSSL